MKPDPEHVAYEAWIDLHPLAYPGIEYDAFVAGYRAALQSQVSDTGWKEAAIAWEVCASLHRQYCKGKDPLFTTRQGDFVRHATESRHRALRAEALQSQDRQALTRLLAACPTTLHCDDFHHAKADQHMSGAYCPPLARYLAAIDHARRVEGDGNE